MPGEALSAPDEIKAQNSGTGMTKLSVNVNKIATLRNSRGGSQPSVTEFAAAAIASGAHGITVHPRPDERHIRRTDVFELRDIVRDVEFNIEGYPDDRYMQIVYEARPDQATLVPDPPEALTSSAGWDCISHGAELRKIVGELKARGIRVSIFLEHDVGQVEAAAATGTDRIEFYTEPFARAFEEGRGRESYQLFEQAALKAKEAGLGINAGHDLNLENMAIMRDLPGLLEVSIGHALVTDALWMGWDRATKAYLDVLAGGKAHHSS